jgi:hypothetical protein
LAFISPELSWLLVLTVICMIGALAIAVFSSVKFFKWKQSVNRFVKELSKHKSSHLTITDNFLKFKSSEVILIDKWSSIQSTTIEPGYILLFNQNKVIEYFLPAKSMSASDFEALKIFIKAKIQ